MVFNNFLIFYSKSVHEDDAKSTTASVDHTHQNKPYRSADRSGDNRSQRDDQKFYAARGTKPARHYHDESYESSDPVSPPTQQQHYHNDRNRSNQHQQQQQPQQQQQRRYPESQNTRVNRPSNEEIRPVQQKV
jgi:hypothetical protein